MPFWLILISLALTITILTIVPIWRKSLFLRYKHEGVSRYRLQKKQLVEEAEQGILTPNEATHLHHTLDRALLTEYGIQNHDNSRALNGFTSIFIALVIMVGSISIYMISGNPELPDKPLAEQLRRPANTLNTEELLLRTQAHLSNNPADIKGWRLIVPVYIRLQDFEKAEHAQTQIIKLEGEKAQNLTSLAEIRIRATPQHLTPEAERLFLRAIALDKHYQKPYFYLAVGFSAQKRYRQSADMWRRLVALADPDAPWRNQANAEILRMEQLAKTGKSLQDAPRFSRKQRENIDAMVDGLAARLENDGGSAEEWARLIRSYRVLKQHKKMQAALVKARKIFANDANALNLLGKEAGQFSAVEHDGKRP